MHVCNQSLDSVLSSNKMKLYGVNIVPEQFNLYETVSLTVPVFRLKLARYVLLTTMRSFHVKKLINCFRKASCSWKSLAYGDCMCSFARKKFFLSLTR